MGYYVINQAASAAFIFYTHSFGGAIAPNLVFIIESFLGASNHILEIDIMATTQPKQRKYYANPSAINSADERKSLGYATGVELKDTDRVHRGIMKKFHEIEAEHGLEAALKHEFTAVITIGISKSDDDMKAEGDEQF